MGRKSLKETRQKQIIKAFYKLAKKEGLENASIAKTADLLKINPSLVIHYFKTKEHLVYGLVEYILDRYLLIFDVPEACQHHPKRKLLAVIDNIFSHKWNTLFDDSVSYSCYSLTFRDKTIKKKYKLLLDSLRKNLETLIIDCNENGYLQVKNTAAVADLVFILVDGAYYYLSLVSDKAEYEKKLSTYKKRALGLLNFATSAAS
ncbi:TetR/AcrR family transcriptional regulator [Niabella drilacis]|uniref:Biofilm operon icaADBC HTH-type negative transcriptional regulator IcaR n=1 Tax=Niabella drilacis (strain DSM 25811 / CCM 8410 / CCUG 62505 / LMG 26954 / E90) TaxID=1285928 RepID=A0A1G6NEK7_NIADE|nr:TetR/AcrR family transcriptional regulator [Niabella drilacis]SDC65717.1 transcriptional regulator, TetR family [Niabella drilacis]